MISVNGLTHNALKRLAAPPVPGSVISKVTVTSFPNVYSYKHDCQDPEDTWNFEGASVRISASSAIGDHDCWKLRAGRGATVAVPPGAKGMSIAVNAHVEVETTAVSFGAFGESHGHLGVRIFSPTGAVLGSTKVGNVELPVAGNTLILKGISSENSFPNPVPVNTGGFNTNLQEGDEGSAGFFAFPGDPGPNLEVTMFVGGWVDADLQGLAVLDATFTPRSMTITFRH